MFLDLTLIHAAKGIYCNYYDSRSQVTSKPLGVVLNKETLKGQLVFREGPILLPGECFINIKQIEEEIYNKN